MRFLYTVLLILLLPCAIVRLLWREPDTRRRWRGVAERLGLSGGARLEGRPVCLHAVSVGEAQLTRPLVRFLQDKYPSCPLLITTGTPGGRQIVLREYAGRLPHHYLPYDLPLFVGRFLDRFQPRLMVILETEIWPNLYRACKSRSIPVLLVNARLSERSARRYRWLAGFTRSVLQELDFVIAQSGEDAGRFRVLGLPAARLSVSPNLKYSVARMNSEQTGALALHSLGAGRPVWIAGSTHPGEERVLLRLHRQLRRIIHPRLLLILAPRHVTRCAEVARLCRAEQLGVCRSSQGVQAASGCAVWLLDTLGSLRHCYPVADVAFVAGSLLPGLRGHNVLEPMACGVATITGPHAANFSAMIAALVHHDALLQARDAEALQAGLAQLLLARRRRAALAENGRDFICRQAAALHRLTSRLARFVERLPAA